MNVEVTQDTQPELAIVPASGATKEPKRRAKPAPQPEAKPEKKRAWEDTAKSVGRALCGVVRYLFSFQWVVDITQWLIATGGKIAESAFLLATTYVIVNLVAHKLVLWLVFSDTNVIDTFNQVSMIAFSVLPELIAIPALVRSYQQWRYLFLTRRLDFFVWAVLFSAPTIVFVAMTIITINGFVSLESTGQIYSLSPDSLHWRVISGWSYGCFSMLYAKIGQGSITKALDDLRKSGQEKDAKVENLAGEIHRLNAVIESQNRLLQEQKKQNSELKTTFNKSADTALQAYSEECISWLKGGDKTAFVEQITTFTGHSKRKVSNAIAAGKLKVSPRNKQLVLMSSLVEWLKENPPVKEDFEIETGPVLRVVNGD